jgi:PPOX class probable F420-dependent enzyme
MPRGPVPTELQVFLRKPNPCVVATIRPDGELHTAATWYEWTDAETVLLNMDAGRRRLGHMRDDPRVALTVLDEAGWYSHLSLIGRVREIRRDPDLADIDRLSQHYLGCPYRDRKRERWTAIVEVSRWHSWGSPGAGE